MVRPKDAKVWNEDLALALRCRYEMCERLGKKQQYAWREGMEKIEGVRGDIYCFSTGRIVNLPSGLSKTVHTLCTDVIQGRKGIIPDGYGAVTAEEAPPGNRFARHPYLKAIKARGGAYAILMAFHYSQSKTLTQDQICRAAQPYCDEAMLPNFHAGRPHGAWSAKKTLVRHGILIENGAQRTFVQGRGFRTNGPAFYTLTHPDGTTFIQAMLEKFPQDAGAAPGANFAAAAGAPAFDDSPFGTPRHVMPTRPPVSTASNRSNKLAGTDEEKLREWVLTAQDNDTMDFAVSKARRKHIHDACDALQRELPGLRLDHSSSYNDKGTRRILTVTVLRRPSGNGQALLPGVPPSAKRPLHLDHLAIPGSAESVASLPTAKRVRPDIPASMAAANAAFERQAFRESLLETKAEESYEEMERRAMEESLLSARKNSPDSIAAIETPLADDMTYKDEPYDDLERAIELSLLSAETPLADDEVAARNKAMEDQAMRESLLSSGKTFSSPETPPATKNGMKGQESVPFSDRKMPAKDIPRAQETNTKRALFPKDETQTIDLVSSHARLQNSNSAARSRQDESIVVESSGRRTETISLVDEQDQTLKLPPYAAQSPREPLVIDLDDSQDVEVFEIEDSQETAVDEQSQQSIIVLDDSQDDILPTASPIAVGLAAQSGSNSQLPHLHVLIDSRERNRNATPRHLRMELTRLLTSGTSGSLKSIWPQGMPTSNVEEMQLALGDFAFDVEFQGDAGRKRLSIAVERKRVNDLVQRSVSGDHWKQFMRMRDDCRLSIFLIENDTRTSTRFTAFGSQNLEGWTPHGTLIEDEKSLFLFFGRALLSSRSTNFIQTKDEVSSLRAVGALGLMATFSPELRRSAAKAAPPSSNNETRLVDRLMACGIPWQLARHLGKTLGSINHLKSLYEDCASNDCRSSLLAPFISETEYNSCMRSTIEGWSDAVFRGFSADNTKAKKVRILFDDHRHKVQDQGAFLSALYAHDSLEAALDAACSSASSTRPGTESRLVTIELSSEQSRFFPAQTEESFFALKIRDDNPLGTGTTYDRHADKRRKADISSPFRPLATREIVGSNDQKPSGSE